MTVLLAHYHMRTYWYLLIAIVSFLLAVSVNYRSLVKQETVLVIDKKCYHLHHWMIIALLGLMALAGARLPRAVMMALAAVAGGAALEGLLFSDWRTMHESCERAFTITHLAFTEDGLAAPNTL